MVDLYSLGGLPPLGQIPRLMYAQTLRQSRYGEPAQAFEIEVVPVPEIRPDECLVLVMAAGINFNGIWGATGSPLDLVHLHKKNGEDVGFHIGGSDAAGIVYRVGRDVPNVAVGDEVVVHGGWWDSKDPYILAGGDPAQAPSLKMWGYETNYGGFGQFARVKGHQLVPKAPHLSWEEAAAFMVSGATAYRALYGFAEHRVRAGDVVLIWGGAGGLGSLSIQLCALAGAIPVAVVSSPERGDYCRKLGARGFIDRTDYTHWGTLPRWSDTQAYNAWLGGARRFGRAIWEVVGAQRNPRIVVEHPGEATLPTSCFVCDTGGMIIFCAGTSGFNGTFDLRYHWVRQKRLQGTHYANLEQVRAINELVTQRKVNPALSKTFPFEHVGTAHQLMADNRHPSGNMAVLVSAPAPGLGRHS